MKLFALALLLSVLGMIAPRPQAAVADTLFVYYIGYDYEAPNPNPATFGEPGSQYNSIGTAMDISAPLVPDTTSNNYTFAILGMTPTSQETLADTFHYDSVDDFLAAVGNKYAGVFFAGPGPGRARPST